MAAVLAAALLGGAAPAHATSFDSLAPETAPPHWLPPEPWVYAHWLPFDERRLYRLLDIDRGDLWRQLRDDRRTVAQLARRHGWKDMRRLAAALAGPDAELRSRALRLLTQGHLAQHVFFHSLHQFALPSMAPRLFGVSDIEFRALRRAELSPLAIGRLHGRSVGEIEAGAIAVLRRRVRQGIAQGEMPAAQGALLLRRQVSQLPRWLGQNRYNGPPPTHRGQLLAAPRDHAANPMVSADGTRVVYEAYRQQLEAAITFGEIAVMQRDLGGGAEDLAAAPRAPSLTTSGGALVSRPVAPAADKSPRPASAYNPTVSGDGTRIAFERAPGNNNFAKRYGRIGIFLAGPSGAARKVDQPPKRAHFSQSAYNPQLSADGSRLAFQAVRDGGRVGIYLRDLGEHSTVRVAGGLRDRGTRFADVYEPSLTADGSLVAYTRVAGRVGGGRVTSRVYVRDIRSGATVAASAPGLLASNPQISSNGRRVAYVAGRRLHVRELDSGADARLPTKGTTPLDPQLSRDGSVVAFTAVGRDGSSSVFAFDRRTARLTVVARDAGDPSISGDGTVVAFSSRASGLDPDKSDDTEAVFVRDLDTGKTTLVSAPSATEPAPPPRLPSRRARRVPGAAVTVPVFDNQFAGGEPTVRVKAGSVVAWAWRGRESHQVTAVGKGFGSAMQAYGTYRARLSDPGVYRIVCSLHSPGMRMRVVVQ